MRYDPRIPYDSFFYGTMGLVCGTFIAAHTVTLWGVIGGIVLYFLLMPRPAYVLISLTIFCISSIVGATYYHACDVHYREHTSNLENETVFTGVIRSMPKERLQGQVLSVSLDQDQGLILVYTEGSDKHVYGEYVRIKGTLTPPSADTYGDYLAGRSISGSVFQGTITVLSYRGNPILRKVFAIHAHIQSILAQHLPRDEYALLQAILIGDRDALSVQQKEQLSHSGTTHITALSGAHITIIIFGLYSLLQLLFPTQKKTVFILTFSIVFLFIAMTGFVVSAVRAGIMALATNLGTIVERPHRSRNAIALAVLLLTIHDPKTPVADIGFQLSCLAVTGIIYGTPLLQRIPFFTEPGYIAWRHLLATTIAAQIAVLPISLSAFQNVSLVSLPANIAIVTIMPLLTLGGFILALFGSIHTLLGAVVALPLSFLLSYANHTIAYSASIATPFGIHVSTLGMTVYYALLTWLLVALHRATSLQSSL